LSTGHEAGRRVNPGSERVFDAERYGAFQHATPFRPEVAL
jgi:hypothetical protein